MDWVPPSSFAEYRLVQALGRGRTGQVWLVHDTVLDRLVAVKFLTELAAHDALRQRFLTAARAAARVQHPNIVAVYRVGELAARPYVISEYVRGTRLDQLAWPVAWPRLLDIALGLGRGLAAAHRDHVLHGELEPANVILSDAGEVKLRNFGFTQQLALPALAGSVGEPSRAVVQSSAEMTSPAYLAPEARRGEPATARSDVYSLGAVLHALATGAAPDRNDASDAGGVPPLAIAAPGIDAGFVAIVDRCLRRDPMARFASGEAVRDAIEGLARRSPRHGAPVRPRTARWWRAGVAGAGCVLAIAAYHAFGSDRARAPSALRPSSPHLVPQRACSEDMVSIPAGAFEMGSPDGDPETEPDEQPRHRVTLSAYCIDRTEVTVAAYAACVARGRCPAAARTTNWPVYSEADRKRISRWCNGEDRPEHPINCVDWDQAATYCRWRGKRLPTEAEWEYAAREGDGRVYPWRRGAPQARLLNACGTECVAMMKREQRSWYALHDGNDGWDTTAPVGSYPDGASPFGVLDLAGNVGEWTADWYGAYATTAETDPQGPVTGTSRVSRGGGWDARDAHSVRATSRGWPDPSLREVNLGFRCGR